MVEQNSIHNSTAVDLMYKTSRSIILTMKTEDEVDVVKKMCTKVYGLIEKNSEQKHITVGFLKFVIIEEI